MRTQIIGISGSPIKNSNTDRLVQAVLNSSGLKSEFVKLSKHNIKPCIKVLTDAGTLSSLHSSKLLLKYIRMK